MNPYEVLGVEKTASDTEIKKAYRKLSKQWHPDVNDTPEAEKKFKEISDAYEILGDPQKRSNYDTFGDPNGQPSFTGNSFEGFNPFNFFTSGRTYKKRTGDTLQYNLHLNLFEACFGTKKNVKFSHAVICPDCNGKGGEGEAANCPVCGGSGVEVSWLQQITCRKCHGKGKIFTKECPTCRGTGTINKEEKILVTIPAGSRTGMVLNARGKGNASTDGGPAGDLLICLNILPDSKFHLMGDDLETVEKINIAQALLGGKKTVELLDQNSDGSKKHIALTIPKKSSAGTRLRIPGKGFSTGRGDRGSLYIVLDIVIPEIPAENEKDVKELVDKLGIPLED